MNFITLCGKKEAPLCVSIFSLPIPILGRPQALRQPFPDNIDKLEPRDHMGRWIHGYLLQVRGHDAALHGLDGFLLQSRAKRRERLISIQLSPLFQTSAPGHNDRQRVGGGTLRRLPWYLSNVKLLRKRGERFVSSTQISKEINIDASQIAKDLSYVNISGRTRVGYEIDTLIAVLEDFLGFTNIHKAFLFGVGSLGGALLRDSGLNHFGLEIVAAFDVNPDLVGTALNGIPIYHSDDFEEKMQAYDVNIGVLTVPIEIAQKITDTMVAGGIKAVWNFTPFRIRVPEDIVVQNTSLYAHLAVMFNRLNFNEIR